MKIFLSILVLFVSTNSYSKWKYDKKTESIYSVYHAKKTPGWPDVFVILRVYGNEVVFIATVPFSEYKKAFTFNLPKLLRHKGHQLVKHDTFFWGKKGSDVNISIGKKTYSNFDLST